MKPLRRLCVFCGASAGVSQAYVETARALGCAMAAQGVALVYGGGKVGLMGALSEAVRLAGGETVGIIPESLMRAEIADGDSSELIVVDSMHTRKKMMADHAEAFLALPGGVGTFEELFEILTWRQLGFHRKPVALLNVDGFYSPLIQFLDHAERQGFMRGEWRDWLMVGEDHFDLLDFLRTEAAALDIR